MFLKFYSDLLWTNSLYVLELRRSRCQHVSVALLNSFWDLFFLNFFLITPFLAKNNYFLGCQFPLLWDAVQLEGPNPRWVEKKVWWMQSSVKDKREKEEVHTIYSTDHDGQCEIVGEHVGWTPSPNKNPARVLGMQCCVLLRHGCRNISLTPASHRQAFWPFNGQPWEHSSLYYNRVPSARGFFRSVVRQTPTGDPSCTQSSSSITTFKEPRIVWVTTTFIFFWGLIKYY